MSAIIYFFLLLQCWVDPYRLTFYLFPVVNFFRLIIPNSPWILPLIKAFNIIFISACYVIKTCSLLFFIDAGNNIPNGVNLYTTFLYFLNIFNTLSFSISIWKGFRPLAFPKLSCALIIIVSIVSGICVFLFFFQSLLNGCKYSCLLILVCPCLCWSVESLMNLLLCLC